MGEGRMVSPIVNELTVERRVGSAASTSRVSSSLRGAPDEPTPDSARLALAAANTDDTTSTRAAPLTMLTWQCEAVRCERLSALHLLTTARDSSSLSCALDRNQDNRIKSGVQNRFADEP